ACMCGSEPKARVYWKLLEDKMTPRPVIQYPSGQVHSGQAPQSPVAGGGMQYPNWQPAGMTPTTPVTSREPRLYSSRIVSPGGSHVLSPQNRSQYSPSSPFGTSTGGPGPSNTPSPRMDTSYNLNRSIPNTGQPIGTTPGPQTSSMQFGLSDQELIEHAARTTDRLMNNDLRTPSLYNSLMQAHDPQLAQAGMRPISGFMDHDYPPVVQQQIVTENQYSIAHNAPIPPELNEMLSQGEPKTCKMGVFPDIFRAWMTIESDLYLWDFRDGSDLSFYDGLKEPIITMALVPAKPNVFVSTIKHLLCISTASEIVILGFILTDPSLPMSPTSQVLELVPQPIFVISSDSLRYVVIHGTKSGRIFLGASNGTVHEVAYQAGRGWFKDRCWKKDLSSGYFSSFFKFISPGAQGDAVIQIASDDERNILYTRSLSGALYAYDLAADGNGFRGIGHMTFEGIVNEVIAVSKKTLEANLVKKVLAISPVKMGEMCLVAVLESGTRLYFSCYSPLTNVVRDINIRPNVFQLIHIRLPPGHCPATSLQRPSSAHLAYYSAGYQSFINVVLKDRQVMSALALASHTTQEQDSFWIISPLLYPTQCLSEVFYVHKLPGRAVDIQFIPTPEYDLSLQQVPDVVSQHLKWHKQIVVLTSSGSVVFRANKPYEILKSTLIERKGPENIKGHFELGMGREYPLSNSFLLAVHPFDHADQTVHDMAIRALYIYGNFENVGHQQSFDGGRVQSKAYFFSFGLWVLLEESLNVTLFVEIVAGPHDRSLDFNPNMVSTPRQEMAHSVYGTSDVPSYISPPVAGGGYPHHGMNQQPMYSSSGAQMQQQVQTGSPLETYQLWSCSPRHDAIYLVVGRVLYEFWHRPLVKSGFLDGPESVKIVHMKSNYIHYYKPLYWALVPNVQGDEVTYATAFLHSILRFLNENPSLCMIRTSVTPAFGNINVTDGRHAHDLERNSLAALKNFLSITLEVLGMWKILCDHQFHIVLQGLDERLQTTTMRNLILNGQNTVSIIINALISKYLGDNAAVDAISLRLREVCPTLFRNEDAIGSKVAEILAKVRNITDVTEKEALLKESLILSEKISGHSRININNFCRQYGELGFPVGAVRLVVSSAKTADPDQLALSVVKANSSNNDPTAIRAFQTRSETYKVVFDMLDHYVTLATNAQSPVPRSKDDRIQPSVAQKLADETIHAILSSDDEAFHITLYNWLLERKLFDRLLEIKHGFLDSFLQRAADAVTTGKWPGGGTPANDTRVLDLLWRHHEMNSNHTAAAQILSKLAESTTTGLNLQQRLEYLSRAIICCKSTSRRGDLLEILEDKLDVARIQKSILDSISLKVSAIASSGTTEEGSSELKNLEEAIEKLNSQLMNITQLYSEFAHPLKLHEAKLEIFHAAGHADRNAIEAVWSDIIEAELSSVSRQPAEAQMEIIRRKLVAVGKKYIRSPSFFPVEFLIEHLESMKPQDTDDVGWVFTIMMEVEATFSDLLVIYEKLWKRLNMRENTSSEEIQIAKVIIYMVDQFARNEVDLRNINHIRLELLEKCKQLIAHMMVEFSGRTDDTKQIKMQLDRVQDKLDRYRSFTVPRGNHYDQ
ncbi:hypothetical protein Ocin01_05049, partial [Orchesella cincta]